MGLIFAGIAYTLYQSYAQTVRRDMRYYRNSKNHTAVKLYYIILKQLFISCKILFSSARRYILYNSVIVSCDGGTAFFFLQILSSNVFYQRGDYVVFCMAAVLETH